jgi:valyl-tRNA synthetase
LIGKFDLTFEINGEIYKRTFGVLDCWFESGMAGLSRYGYPDIQTLGLDFYFVTSFTINDIIFFFLLLLIEEIND